MKADAQVIAAELREEAERVAEKAAKYEANLAAAREDVDHWDRQAARLWQRVVDLKAAARILEQSCRE